MHVIFSLSLSLSLLPPPPDPSVQVCNVNIKTSTFFFLNVVDNQSQAGSSPAGSESPAGGHTNKNTCIYWKSKKIGRFCLSICS